MLILKILFHQPARGPVPTHGNTDPIGSWVRNQRHKVMFRDESKID